MMSSKRLVFFGNERLATAVGTKAPILRGLLAEGYEVAAVVASFSPGQSRYQRRLEVTDIADSNHIPVLLPDKPTELLNELKGLGAQAGVLAAYGKILPPELIDAFPSGIINIHPSLLPAYRGPTPIETAILDGGLQTGVSIMKLSPEMDAGPVFAQEPLRLTGQEAKQELADKLNELGARLLLKTLPAIVNGSLAPEPQSGHASYTKLLKKSDGQIDWQQPAELIERQVRAFLGFPRSRSQLFGHDIIITRTRTAASLTDGFLVQAANPGYIEILELIAPSGRTMSGADFIRGYRQTDV